MAKVFLCKQSDLEPGEMKKVTTEEAGDICVYNKDGTFYATADQCTHATASLAEGEFYDDVVSCPVHWGEFNILTGEAISFPCEIDLRTYRIIVEGDDVYADTEQESEEAIAFKNS